MQQIDMEPPIAPYFDLFRVHHAIGTPDVFYREVASNPGFDVCRADIDFLVQVTQSVASLLGPRFLCSAPRACMLSVLLGCLSDTRSVFSSFRNRNAWLQPASSDDAPV